MTERSTAQPSDTSADSATNAEGSSSTEGTAVRKGFTESLREKLAGADERDAQEAGSQGKAAKSEKSGKPAKSSKSSKTVSGKQGKSDEAGAADGPGQAATTEKSEKTGLLGKVSKAKESATATFTSSASTPEESTKPAPAKKAPARGPRRARLRLTRIDPWSVMKTSFLLSIAFAIVTVVSVLMVWQVLGAAGVWDSTNDAVRDTALTGANASDFDIQDYIGTSRVLGFTLLVAAIDVILLTAIATLGAFLYNMAAALLGGIEVTLAEDR